MSWSDLVNAKVYKRGTNGVWEQVNVALDTEEQISVKLVSGQSYIITGLPPGTRYTIGGLPIGLSDVVPQVHILAHGGVHAADVTHQLAVQEYPHIIVAEEVILQRAHVIVGQVEGQLKGHAEIAVVCR